MKIMICVGSTCHLCGSKKVVGEFRRLVAENHMDAEIELAGKFCMGKCGESVNIMVDDTAYSVKPDEVEEFFKTEILPKVS